MRLIAPFLVNNCSSTSQDTKNPTTSDIEIAVDVAKMKTDDSVGFALWQVESQSAALRYSALRRNASAV
jgi:hypothetical protein